MKASDVRKVFLDFFRGNAHVLVPSSSVIPAGDKTLLFTNAGMNQFKDIFTGQTKSRFPRATTVQKCIRAGGKHNDLDNVGYTARHLTFFEMLGNFSFGDYFKEEAIGYAWELVTKRFGISPDRLWITVFREDDEARALWRKIAAVPEARIVGLGEKDNFWSMGEVGPCGPCSEILVDRGEAYGPADLDNGDRFFEIWNLVFMQFDQKPDGTRSPLPRPSIDTGMGLERMAMVLQGVDSVFETDVFQPMIRRVEEIAGIPYDPGPAGVPHRVISDHVRSLVFAFADGAEPSNEGRGYVLRRILRRAARYGRRIHKGASLLHRLVGDVVGAMGEAYPEIRDREVLISRIIQNEEERFGETLDKGIELFEEVVARLRKEGSRTVPGEDTFRLYDTFGFPVDLVEQMASEISFQVDLKGFEKLMEAQKERSRGSSQFVAAETGADDLEIERYPQTHFVGYDTTRAQAELQATDEREGVWRLILQPTPFYGESGGQVGDVGTVRGEGFVLDVQDTRRDRGRFVHYCRLAEGSPSKIRAGSSVEASVDEDRRAATARNHTATHLLHAALRRVVGTHVHQKGSLVEPARLRFDVTHFAAFTPEELLKAEQLVLDQIVRNVPVETCETDYESAVKDGAIALFGEKYGDKVRVVRIGDFSVELCGGTHVRRTGDIGLFLVEREGSVSSGVRRLEALTGLGAQSYHRKNRETLEVLSKLLKVPAEGLLERLQKVLDENRELKAKRKPAQGEPGPTDGGGPQLHREKFGEILFLSTTLQGADGKALREVYDRLKREAEELIVALCGSLEGRIQLMVGVSPKLVGKGWDARQLFEAAAAQVGLKGGGRPEMVQAGGVATAESARRCLEEVLRAVQAKITG